VQHSLDAVAETPDHKGVEKLIREIV